MQTGLTVTISIEYIYSAFDVPEVVNIYTSIYDIRIYGTYRDDKITCMLKSFFCCLYI